MKQFATIAFLILSISSAIYCQSGRVKAAATPAPVTLSKSEVIYSESGVYVRRRLFKPEDLGKRKKKKSKKKRSKMLAEPKTIEVKATDDLDDDLITVDSTLVSIPVAVHDRNGLYIPNLNKEDFKVFENGIEQELAYFATSEKPFTVVLLLDTSPSTEYRIEEIQEAAKSFVDRLKPQDKVIVIEFDANVHVLTKVTNDRKRIRKGIDKADFGGGTSLYDAVEHTIEKRLSRISGKKAIVLFTDGVDTTSRKADYLENIDLVEESDVTIYPIYYNTYRKMVRRSVFNDPLGRYPRYGNAKGTTAKDYAVGRQYLLEIAGSTGGRIFVPEASDDGLKKAFDGIAEELRRQYNLGFYPDEIGKAGERKKIKVRVNRPNLVVRNRDSYVVGKTKQ